MEGFQANPYFKQILQYTPIYGAKA